MKIVVRDIRVTLKNSEGDVFAIASERLKDAGIKADRKTLRIFRKSVDTRHKTIYLVYSVLAETDVEISAGAAAKAGFALLEETDPFKSLKRGSERPGGRPVIVGFGPCGMFAALCLAENGYRPLVIERGEPVAMRSVKVARFMRTGELDPGSNVQFGAGGAGTFSDGKLVTRINDKKVSYVLETFVRYGAPGTILTEARPHIGTDRLLTVVSRMDARIKELGGEILYGTRLTGIKIRDGKAVAVETEAGDIDCGPVILATGNSARDTYGYLIAGGFAVRPKPFSVGVRIEHLQSELDRAVFGSQAGNPLLGHAEYAMSYRRGDDCVYTFCMCPGGEVIASASEEGGVVTNGMSRFARDGKNANSALVVNVSPEDPVEYQRSIERSAFVLGGGGYAAPFQTVGDFMSDRTGSQPSRVLPTYRGGNVKSASLSSLFDRRVSGMLKTGIRYFDGKIKGFAAPYALLTAPETRTSAPFRIERGPELTASGTENIYPAGEGAGYAGGITSAAVDGINTAIKIMEKYSSD